MLFDPLDTILSAPNKVRVLRALAPLETGVSGREVARLAGVSRAAMGALEDLVDVGVVIRREATGQHLYSLNPRNYFATRLVRLFASEATRVQAIFQTLRNAVARRGEEGCDEVLSLAVFGSAARGEAGPRSDFDVLGVVAQEAQAEPVYDALADVSGTMLERYGLRLSPVVLTADRFRRGYADGDTLIRSALEDAIRVHGIPLHEVAHEPAK